MSVGSGGPLHTITDRNDAPQSVLGGVAKGGLSLPDLLPAPPDIINDADECRRRAGTAAEVRGMVGMQATRAVFFAILKKPTRGVVLGWRK